MKTKPSGNPDGCSTWLGWSNQELILPKIEINHAQWSPNLENAKIDFEMNPAKSGI
jgi:hypothetical protein